MKTDRIIKVLQKYSRFQSIIHYDDIEKIADELSRIEAGEKDEVSDEVIEKYSKDWCTTSRGKFSDLIQTGIIIGAKAMRDGLIK